MTNDVNHKVLLSLGSSTTNHSMRRISAPNARVENISDLYGVNHVVAARMIQAAFRGFRSKAAVSRLKQLARTALLKQKLGSPEGLEFSTAAVAEEGVAPSSATAATAADDAEISPAASDAQPVSGEQS